MLKRNLFIYVILIFLISCEKKSSVKELNNKYFLKIADSFYACNKYDSALNYYNKVKTIENCGRFHFNRGNCFATSSKHKEAINDFLISIKMHYRISDANFNIASSYVKLGDFNKAYFYYKNVLKINPNDSIAILQVRNISELLNIKE